MTDDELAARLYPSMQPDTYDPSKHPAISAEVREIRNQPERQLYKARSTRAGRPTRAMRT